MSCTLHPIYMWERTFVNLKIWKILWIFKIPYLLNCEWFLNLGSRLLSPKFLYHQNYVITLVVYLVLCKINHIWCNTYPSSNILLKNQNPKFNLMNFEFEFFNFHISHLAQLGMINIILKYQENNMCQNVHNFHHYLTWFLAPISILAPNWSCHRSKIGFYQITMLNVIKQ